jgi:hypothetical protein
MMNKTGKSAKAKPRAAAAKSAKPKATHKKMSLARKAPARKAPAKHTAKAKAPSAARSEGGDYTKFSGKFTVRLPKSLHQALVARAEREGVSLNLFVTNALASTVTAKGKR